MNAEAIVREVAALPHLKLLDLGEDFPALRDEVFDAFAGAGGSRLAPFSVEGFNLQVAGILDYGRDPANSGRYLDHLDPALRQGGIMPTAIGERTPRLRKLIESVTEFKGRVRISRLAAGQSVRLHDHKYKEFILHLPLVTHPRVQMSAVIGGVDTRQHYAAGELWHFNAFHRHGVHNHSPIDRYHVWCGFPVRVGDRYNQRLLQLMEAALVRAN